MAKTKERFITDEKGQKEAVVLDVAAYENLLEDLNDLRLIAERKNEPTVPLEQVKRNLKQSGLL
jgi:PHD/YefM family antitoxin component YafN of YafNO toxin-antitoxin module